MLCFDVFVFVLLCVMLCLVGVCVVAFIVGCVCLRCLCDVVFACFVFVWWLMWCCCLV